jgi:hypothetical protein
MEIIMKTILITMTALALSFSASAFSKTKVKTQMPAMSFAAPLSGVINVNYSNLCTDGEFISTKNAIKVCVELKKRNGRVLRTRGERGQRICKTYENRVLATSIDYVKTVCTNWQRKSNGEKKCARWERQDKQYPLEYTVVESLYKQNNMTKKWRWARYLSKTEFSLPSCN